MTILPIKQFPSRLLRWFDQHGRKSLPWQQNKTPYRVWVSEIMLQQTQVATVIPYYERFMQHFPDVLQLANASDDAIMHLWAGLGYYSRARNLHRAAKMVIEEFGGAFPSTLEGLLQLPGIGPSTAGAILAIAYNKQATILDGNVKRVLARLHGVSKPINDKATENALWELAVSYTPKARVADYTQAIMDLGATCCTRAKPQCEQCPFVSDCVARQQGIVDLLPMKKATKKIPERVATFLIVRCDMRIYLCKRPETGIWGGLWSLPQLEGHADEKDVRAHCQQQMRCKVKSMNKLPAFRHTFSHYHLDIYPLVVDIESIPLRVMEDGRQIWYNLLQPEALGLPKPVKKIIEGLYDTSRPVRQVKKRSRRTQRTAAAR